ncbi:MAG: SprT-like domain-containing protein [Odoribacter sp.]|nr:SprT-like domain-containing protein [Odoribacter sp.]MDY3033751.1 hypothetical protein [Odoribacter sp.]
MKKIIVFLTTLFGLCGCYNLDTVSESEPDIDVFNVWAVYFQKEYFKQWGVDCQDDLPLDNHVLLFEYAELGTSYEYELFYAIPAKNESTGNVDCFLLYPFEPKNGELRGKLEGGIGHPVVVDFAYMQTLQEQNMFRYSARFLLWKRKGLSVREELYLLAEEICKRMDNWDNRVLETRSGVAYEQYDVTVCYELSPYVYCEDGEIVVKVPLIEALERLLVREFKCYGDVLRVAIGILSGTFDITYKTQYGSIKEVVNRVMMNAEIVLKREYNVEFTYYSVYAIGSNPGPNWKEGSLGGSIGCGRDFGYGSGSGELDVTPDPIINIDSLKESPILLDIYSEFYEKSELFRKMLKDFCVENSIAHLEWVVRDKLKNDGFGEFSMVMKDYTFEIRLNELLLVRYPKLFVCKTMMHEAIHARIFMRLLKATENPVGSDITKEELKELRSTLERNDFPTLFDYYQKFTSHGDAQHNYMADYYIETIVNALQEMDPQVDREICKALAWRGLTRTEAWKLLEQSERNKYIKIYQDYVNNTHD